MKFFGSIIFLLLSILSCIDKVSTKQLPLFKIDASFSVEKSIKLSDFAESIEFVPLQTDDDCLIAEALKIRFINDKYYVGSASMQIDRIFIFDKNGKYHNKLYKRGIGPNEYTEIVDFDVMTNENIVVISHSNPRLLIYDLEQNNCIINERLDAFPRNIIVTDGYIFLYNNGSGSINTNGSYNNINYSFEKLDLQGKVLNTFHELDDISRITTRCFSFSNNFDLSGNAIYFTFPLSNIIYEIRENELIPYINIDFGNKRLNKSIFDTEIQSPKQIIDEIKKYDGIYFIDLFKVSSTFFFFTFLDINNNGYIALYDFKKNKTLLGHHIIDDMVFKGNSFTPTKYLQMPTGKSDKDIIWPIEARDLKKIFEKYKKNASSKEWITFQKEHKDLVTICENIKKEDNPILAKIKIRTK